MPHYADGTEAKVGDHVIAPVFNSGGPKAGVIASITPGSESCNALIRFLEVRDPSEEPPRMALREQLAGGASLIHSSEILSEKHGTEGPRKIVYVCADYCDTNKLTKVG